MKGECVGMHSEVARKNINRVNTMSESGQWLPLAGMERGVIEALRGTDHCILFDLGGGYMDICFRTIHEAVNLHCMSFSPCVLLFTPKRVLKT